MSRVAMNFRGISSSFQKQLLGAIGVGALLGYVYRIGSPALQRTLMSVIGDFSSDTLFNVLGLIAIASLALGVAAFGRSRADLSPLRWFVCYAPARYVLSISAAFFGLAMGFSAANFPVLGAVKVFALATFGLVFIIGAILVMLWASFEDAPLPLPQRLVRPMAATASVIALSVFWFDYVR